MSAGIYIRWSTDDQGMGTTLEEQREGCLKWAGARGLTVRPEHIFVDDGVSGAKESRPALNRMNRLIQQGSLSVIIVYKLDRLARQPYIAYKLVEKDWHNKASMVSVTEAHIDTTTTVGQLGFGIATVFASHERNTTRDRTMSGKRRRAAEGRNPGLRPAYGYVSVEKRFVVVEDEAAIVRRIYQEYQTGRTDGRIARGLNDDGIRTRLGGPWHIAAVQHVLMNPAYKGTLVYRDISFDGAFPVIIEEHQWEQVQSVRKQKAKIHPRRLSTNSPYILSGRLVCAMCDRPMNGRVNKAGKYEYRYYACTGSVQFRDCECLCVRHDELEELVVAHLLPLLDEAELSRRITMQKGGRIDLLRKEVRALEARIGGIDQELTRIRQDYRRAKIDADIFNELRTEIESEKVPLSNSLIAKMSALANAEAESKEEVEIREAVNMLRSWEGLTYPRRKRVVHLLTERIEWDSRSKKLYVESVI